MVRANSLEGGGGGRGLEEYIRKYEVSDNSMKHMLKLFQLLDALLERRGSTHASNTLLVSW